MRIGCFGCLGLTIAILVILVAVAGVVFLSSNILEAPEPAPVARFSQADGYAAQRKLYEVVLREAGRSTRQDSLALTEAEVNAFLANHLDEAAGIPMNPLVVRFRQEVLEVQGRTALRYLLQGPPLAQIARYLPAERLDQPVWVTVRARLRLRPAAPGASRGHARVDLTEFMLGKQPLGTWLLSLMLGPTASRLTRWDVPAVVQAVEIAEGRLVIRTR